MTGTAPTPASVPRPAVRAITLPTFAHASEAELARILDFYQVRWFYEPHVFPILWNLDGSVVESFAPDFYLPDLDLYVELTTLRQPLVRKKNRKLRRLRELYPDIRIKLFYARDFRALMLKYGKFGLVDALSGSSGQVVALPVPLVDDDDLADLATVDVAADPDLTAEARALAGEARGSATLEEPAASLAAPVPLLPRRRRALKSVPHVAPPSRSRIARDR